MSVRLVNAKHLAHIYITSSTMKLLLQGPGRWMRSHGEASYVCKKTPVSLQRLSHRPLTPPYVVTCPIAHTSSGHIQEAEMGQLL